MDALEEALHQAVPAALYDGKTAQRQLVYVRAIDNMVELVGHERIAPDQLAPTGQTAMQAWGRKDVDGWRLIFDAPPPPELAALLPRPARYGRWIDRFGLGKSLIALGLLSAAVVGVALKLPEWLGPHIPPSVENRIAQALVGDLSPRFCQGTGGQAALDRLVARVNAGQKPVSVHVIHMPMVNAVTLPGGSILIFDQLLKDANSSDEVAGVIGHEIGHVRHHDVMTSLVRELGLSTVMMAAGGYGGSITRGVLSSSYSRDAESAADGYAMTAMKGGNVSPQGVADFFTRMAKEEGSMGKAGDALNYVSTHPGSGERARRFAASRDPHAHYVPALDKGGWDALADICFNDPKQRSANNYDLLL